MLIIPLAGFGYTLIFVLARAGAAGELP